VLPPANEFLAALKDVLEWLLGVEAQPLDLSPVPGRAGETFVPPVRLAHGAIAQRVGRGRPVAPTAWPAEALGSRMDRIRFGARNRLLVRVTYKGVPRLVEPYSLRMPRTGNLLLYVYEVQRGGGAGGGVKSFHVAELGDVHVTNQTFYPRYLVEL